MIGDRMQAALNEQIVHEFFASQYYLSMSAYFERTGYPGFAHWMRMQADEEREHALRIFDFVNDRDGRVDLGRIDAPPSGQVARETGTSGTSPSDEKGPSSAREEARS